jgi:predicted secreted protein
MTLGLAMILAFCVWQAYAPYPMIPGYVFRHKVRSIPSDSNSQRISVLTLFITALAGANFYSLLNFWPLECQQLYGPDPHAIARAVVAFGFAVALGVIIVDIGLSVFRGANRELLVISSVMMTAGVGALAAVDQNSRNLGIGMSFLGGLGVGGIIVPAAIILTIVSPDEVIATVTAITLSIRLIGGSIGYAIYFNIFQTKVTAVLPINVGLAVAKAGLPLTEIPAFIRALVAQNATALATIQGLTPTILLVAEEAVKVSYTEGFRKIYLVSIAFGGAAILSSLFLGDIRKYMVDRVAVDIH